MDKNTKFVRVIKPSGSDDILVGDVYPCNFDAGENQWRVFHDDNSCTWFEESELDCFEPASEAEFEETVQRAMRDLNLGEAEQKEFLGLWDWRLMVDS